jgi:predicted ATP-grasp superfamily ATP-dependent carboligase
VGYLLHGDGCRLIAASRQLVGCRWCRARPFHYCGSIDLDPTKLDVSVASQVKVLGTLLARHFGLAGLVGADLVVDASGRAWVIEINPRPTASMELAERATGVSLVAEHMAAFAIAAPIAPARHRRMGVWAKAIFGDPRCVVCHGRAMDERRRLAGGDGHSGAVSSPSDRSARLHGLRPRGVTTRGDQATPFSREHG